jgi:hypothetical protein
MNQHEARVRATRPASGSAASAMPVTEQPQYVAQSAHPPSRRRGSLWSELLGEAGILLG